MDIELYLSSSRLPDDTLDKITRDLSRTINMETTIGAEIPKGIPVKGSKGEPVTLGLILLTFISSGAAVALINILKSYIERESTIEISLKKTDGTQYTINAKNLRDNQIQNTLESTKEFFESK